MSVPEMDGDLCLDAYYTSVSFKQTVSLVRTGFKNEAPLAKLRAQIKVANAIRAQDEILGSTGLACGIPPLYLECSGEARDRHPQCR